MTMHPMTVVSDEDLSHAAKEAAWLVTHSTCDLAVDAAKTVLALCAQYPLLVEVLHAARQLRAQYCGYSISGIDAAHADLHCAIAALQEETAP